MCSYQVFRFACSHHDRRGLLRCGGDCLERGLPIHDFVGFTNPWRPYKCHDCFMRDLEQRRVGLGGPHYRPTWGPG